MVQNNFPCHANGRFKWTKLAKLRGIHSNKSSQIRVCISIVISGSRKAPKSRHKRFCQGGNWQGGVDTMDALPYKERLRLTKDMFNGTPGRIFVQHWWPRWMRWITGRRQRWKKIVLAQTSAILGKKGAQLPTSASMDNDDLDLRRKNPQLQSIFTKKPEEEQYSL